MSWIVTSPTGLVIELFDKTNVAIVERMGWRVETAQQYLGRINAEIRVKG
jgi:hypothetical protein